MMPGEVTLNRKGLWVGNRQNQRVLGAICALHGGTHDNGPAFVVREDVLLAKVGKDSATARLARVPNTGLWFVGAEIRLGTSASWSSPMATDEFAYRTKAAAFLAVVRHVIRCVGVCGCSDPKGRDNLIAAIRRNHPDAPQPTKPIQLDFFARQVAA